MTPTRSTYHPDAYTRRATYAPVIVLAAIAAVILLWLGQLASAAMDGIHDTSTTISQTTDTYEEN